MKRILHDQTYRRVFMHFYPAMYRWKLNWIEQLSREWYREKIGHELDLKNPKAFTEKIQWYKLYFKHPDLKRIVDKYEFKQYIEEKLGSGYTIPAYGCFNSVEEIEKAWDSLPEAFVLKSTISSAGKNIHVIKNKAETNFEELKKQLRQCFDPKKTMLNSACVEYFDCRPRVLAEEYVSQVDGQLYDYKVFCFNGKPFCFYTAIDHFEGVLSKITFYDLNWNKLDVRYGDHENGAVQKPTHMREMLEIAEKLSAGFPFVRVDFFDTENKLYLAELTFFPGGGLTPYHPESFDMELGERFVLPKESE